MGLYQLNEDQREAVASDARRLLVLAGAGTGKTETLTRRIAWMIRERNISPDKILAVTFTDKAAKEMRRRVRGSTGLSTRDMWIGTFHNLAHRLLRRHWKTAGLSESFQIINHKDQEQMLGCLSRALKIYDDISSLRLFIGKQKNERRRPDDIGYPGSVKSKMYKAYDDACMRHGVVDFEELLLRSYELLSAHQDILGIYQQRFGHILVDEFQDTNTIEYDWLRLLLGRGSNLTAVGDDDQAIYGWRGAKVENILGFTSEFPDAKIVRLEQNYRSTANILNAANKLIANNKGRLGKNLWTMDAGGELIGLHGAINEQREAEFIAKSIKRWVNSESERSYSQVAVLYRIHHQAKALEDALDGLGIPCIVYGGERAYPLLEIRNACAYIRLVADCDDDASLRQVINVPKRGIDPCVVDDIIQRVARERGCTLWQACIRCVNEESLVNSHVRESLRWFLNLIVSLRDECLEEHEGRETISFPDQVKHILCRSGLKRHHGRNRDEFAASQIENLESFEKAAVELKEEVLDKSRLDSPLTVFADLYCNGEGKDADVNGVRLMTFHSAKGQEFPAVFMAGMEDDKLPFYRSRDDSRKLEEERRLCYVGITRAQKKLWLCHATSRNQYSCDPSRFKMEIPEELTETFS